MSISALAPMPGAPAAATGATPAGPGSCTFAELLGQAMQPAGGPPGAPAGDAGGSAGQQAAATPTASTEPTAEPSAGSSAGTTAADVGSSEAPDVAGPDQPLPVTPARPDALATAVAVTPEAAETTEGALDGTAPSDSHDPAAAHAPTPALWLQQSPLSGPVPVSNGSGPPGPPVSPDVPAPVPGGVDPRGSLGVHPSLGFPGPAAPVPGRLDHPGTLEQPATGEPAAPAAPGMDPEADGRGPSATQDQPRTLTTGTVVSGAGAATPVAPAAPAPVQAGQPAAQPSAYGSAVLEQVLPTVPRMVLRGDGTSKLSLKLHPADLGEVHLTVTVRANVVDVTLSAGPEARAALSDATSQLTSLLDAIGHSTGQVTLRDLGGAVVSTGNQQSLPGHQTPQQGQHQLEGQLASEQGPRHDGREPGRDGRDGTRADQPHGGTTTLRPRDTDRLRPVAAGGVDVTV